MLGSVQQTDFDLESYISRYEAFSETSLKRLLHIAHDPITPPEISANALELAEKHMKSQGNIKKYMEVFGPDKTLPSSIVFDKEWVEMKEREYPMQLQTLEARVKSANTRESFKTLSDFLKSKGHLKEALNALLRSRTTCTTKQDKVQVCLDMIQLGIDMDEYGLVSSNVSKGESLHGSDSLTTAKFRAASALYHLHSYDYNQAARRFAFLPLDLDYNSVLSAEDITLYGSLAGFAALDRKSLQDTILDNSLFKQRLELLPKMRDSLRFFLRAEYATSLKLLAEMETEMRLDIHLKNHVNILLRRVKDRCMVQYFYPYTCISLKKMAQSFFMTEDEAEENVERLIREGRIRNARINAKEGFLLREPESEKEQQKLLRKVKKLGDEFVNQTESMVLRFSCLDQEVYVRSDQKQQKHFSRRNNRIQVYEIESDDEVMDVEIID